MLGLYTTGPSFVRQRLFSRFGHLRRSGHDLIETMGKEGLEPPVACV